MRSLAMLQAIAGLGGFLGGTGKVVEIPTIRDDGSPRRTGRPKTNSDRPKPTERDTEYIKKRHKKLPIALAKLKATRRNENTMNRWSKSKRSKEQQKAHDDRIIHMTARRYGLKEGQQFPLQAISVMSKKGVREAVRQIDRLQSAANRFNIPIQEAYNRFVVQEQV